MKSQVAGQPTNTRWPDSDWSHARYSRITVSGARGSRRHAAQASGNWFHHSMVFGCVPASGSVSRFALYVESRVLLAEYAAEAKLSIEYGPGIGPSASMSVLI